MDTYGIHWPLTFTAMPVNPGILKWLNLLRIFDFAITNFYYCFVFAAPVVWIVDKLLANEGEVIKIDCEYQTSGVPEGHASIFYFNDTSSILPKVRIKYHNILTKLTLTPNYEYTMLQK